MYMIWYLLHEKSRPKLLLSNRSSLPHLLHVLTISINGGFLFLNFYFVLFYFILFHSGFLSTNNDSLFLSLLLYKIIDIAYCIFMVLISLKVCLIVLFGILNFSFKIFIEGMCVVALANVVMTINDSTFHPLLAMLSISS